MPKNKSIKSKNDINTATIAAAPGTSLPKVNIYFEDSEAADFFSALMRNQRIRKFMRSLPDTTLGCDQYLTLIRKGVTEFAQRSVVCLDADVAQKIQGEDLKTVVLLPGQLPPDRLIFEYLHNLPPDNAFWKNDLHFTREVFTNETREVANEFTIREHPISVKNLVAGYSGKKTPREIFKRFYNGKEFQRLLTSKSNPWKHWIDSNPALCNEFLEKLKTSLYNVMKNGYGVDVDKLAALEVKLKKV